MSTAIKEERRFTLRQVANQSGLSVDTLRYYEKEGIISPVQRLENGHRCFLQGDLDWLNFVVCLRSTGMPLKEIRRYRELMMEGDRTASERRELLVKQRGEILKEIDILREALDRMNYKIDYYDSIENSLS